MRDIIGTFFDIYDTLILLGFIVLILWSLCESLKSYISDVKNNKEQFMKDIILLCPIKISLPNRPITNNRFVMFSIPNSSPETY